MIRPHQITTRFRFSALLMLASVAFAACSVPSGGPSNQAMLHSSDVEIIKVTRGVALSLKTPSSPGFPAEYLRQALPMIDRISIGDALQLQIFENVDNGLFGDPRAGPTTMTPLLVDGTGHVSVPYVGRIRANGVTLEQLRATIEQRLAPQTPDPQIIVSRADHAGLSVAVSGDIRQPGTYTLDVSSRRIGAILARAGGVTAAPTQVQVTLRRGRAMGSASLHSILNDPRQDIAVLPGDNVIVTADHRRVFVLGSVGGQRVVPLEKPELTLIDALAESSGLDSEAANPNAVYILRKRSDARSVVYHVDLSEPAGLLASTEFVLQNADVVYVAEAATTRFNKILRAMLGVAAPASQINDLASGG